MSPYTTTPDLMNTFQLLKKEDQIELLSYIKKRYSSSLKVTAHYRKAALSQIESALKG